VLTNLTNTQTDAVENIHLAPMLHWWVSTAFKLCS